jgi:hypothetical protein
MATVRLSFSPYPVHVRTARLVGVAVARRAGVADTALDEVRLAIGEACSRAVALHHRHSLTDLIEVELSDDGQFTVRVIDRAPVAANGTAENAPVASVPTALMSRPDQVDVFGRTADEIEALSEEDVAVGVGLTLLAGLVEDLSVRPAQVGAGTEVEMSWPTGIHR